MLLAKTLLNFCVCLVVRNNSCGNSSSSEFLLFNLNVVPVLFLASDFNLFNCVFVNLTLASREFAIFYSKVTLPWKNFDRVYFIFSKINKTNIGWSLPSSVALSLSSSIFNCPAKSICWIAFGTASNSFYLLKSTAINL